MASERISRRMLLGASLGSAAVVLAGCDALAGADTGITGGTVTRGTIESSLAPGGRADWVLAVPEDPAPRALLVSLHGKGGTAKASFDLGFHSVAVGAGAALVSVSGGDGYWHSRRDGTDSGRLVLEELIPLSLAGAGMRTDARIGFIGWSMGGYGSLLLAGQLDGDRVLGVAPMSAALWTTPGASAPGAFDDREDYLDHDVFVQARLPSSVPVSLACGTQDPFIEANRAYVRSRPDTDHVFDRGGHDGDYWRSHARTLIPWLASFA